MEAPKYSVGRTRIKPSQASSSHHERRVVTILRHELEGVVGGEALLEQRHVLRTRQKQPGRNNHETMLNGGTYSLYQVHTRYIEYITIMKR